MSRKRNGDHPLVDQVHEAAEEARKRQAEEHDEAREATKEGRTGSEREQDVKSQRVAEEHPTDERTQQGEAMKGEQEVTRPSDGEGQRDLLDDPEEAADLLDDPTQTRLQRTLKPGEGIDDPAIAVAKLPDRQQTEQDRWKQSRENAAGGAPFTDRDPEDVHYRQDEGLSPEEITPYAGRNIEQEPTHLVRDADVPDGLSVVPLDAPWLVDPDAPKSGEEGGAPLGEPTDQKHNPGAPWPGPGQTLAASPTPSPEPGSEPTVQFEPPQEGIVWEHKPEAAVGLIGPGAADQELRRLADRSEVEVFQQDRSGGKGPQTTAAMIREQRLAAREEGQRQLAAMDRDRGPKSRDDGTPRDEAGAGTIEHLTDVALEAVGALFRGIKDEPEPYRLRVALEHAARRVMSPQWWDIKAKHFDKRDEGKAA